MADDLSNFDFSGFWAENSYVEDRYVAPFPDDSLVSRVEAHLGVRLPAAYVTLARNKNGGAPARIAHPSPTPTSWADDHVAVHAIFSIGFAEYGIAGEMGSKFWPEEWGYPEDLIYFADCPSAGHDMIALNYRASGPEGEPSVVHVDQEDDYLITELAPDFASFVRGLVPDDSFD